MSTRHRLLTTTPFFSIIAACIPTLKRLFESILRNMGLMSTESGSRSHTGYLKHDGSTRARGAGGGYASESHKLSGMRSQRDPKTSAATTNAETDSLESGEMPIMKPSHKGSVAEFESDGAPAGTSNNYFRTAIKGGDKGAAGGRGGGIQMETTVSVRTEPNHPKRRDGDIV